jgi:hypothetical protein
MILNNETIIGQKTKQNSNSNSNNTMTNKENYIKWATSVATDHNNNGQIMVQTDLVNPDGSITKMLSQRNFKTSNDRIDGHFWLEDMNGKIISDGGFSSYQHKLPWFKDGFNPEIDFVVYQPVPCPIMEQKIIDKQVSIIKNSWSKNDLLGFDESNFKATARQVWKEKDRMLEQGFQCLQYSICEHLYRTEKGEKCRIRFGCAGVVDVLRDKVFWFFGHLDNTNIDEWIVENAVSSDGKGEKPPLHERKMRISEVPNALKVLKEREIQQQVFNAIKETIRIEKAQKIADKALEELLADEDMATVKPIAPKKNKKNKKKQKKTKKQ